MSNLINPYSNFPDSDLILAYNELLDWDCGNGLPDDSFIREVANMIDLPMTTGMKRKLSKEMLLYEIASRFKEMVE